MTTLNEPVFGLHADTVPTPVPAPVAAGTAAALSLTRVSRLMVGALVGMMQFGVVLDASVLDALRETHGKSKPVRRSHTPEEMS